MGSDNDIKLKSKLFSPDGSEEEESMFRPNQESQFPPTGNMEDVLTGDTTELDLDNLSTHDIKNIDKSSQLPMCRFCCGTLLGTSLCESCQGCYHPRCKEKNGRELLYRCGKEGCPHTRDNKIEDGESVAGNRSEKTISDIVDEAISPGKKLKTIIKSLPKEQRSHVLKAKRQAKLANEKELSKARRVGKAAVAAFWKSNKVVSFLNVIEDPDSALYDDGLAEKLREESGVAKNSE